ncbi:YkgJ family cysteine cluster protein [Myxococcota bacterium]|nr:YkgJ family cysteine cluster protein [Myxococcota bacterium]
MDTLVHSWHDDLFEKGDCLECGNCCRTLGPRILPRDVGRLADFLGVSTDEVTRQYLRIDKDGDLVFSSMPCPFLEEDNHCSVYDARPRACREYPHMDQKKIHKHLNLALKNRLTCPVVYEIFIRLAQRYPQ